MAFALALLLFPPVLSACSTNSSSSVPPSNSCTQSQDHEPLGRRQLMASCLPYTITSSKCQVTWETDPSNTAFYNYGGSCTLSLTPPLPTSLGSVAIDWGGQGTSNVVGTATPNGLNPLTFAVTGTDVCLFATNPTTLGVYNNGTLLAQEQWTWNTAHC